MDEELQALIDAWENRPAAGEASSGEDGAELAKKDRDVYALADKYVAGHSEDFAAYDVLSLDELVSRIDEHGAAGRNTEAFKLQVFIWHKYEPQNIGGTYEPKLRVTNGA